MYPAWAEIADEQAAVLRDVRVRWRTNERMHALIDELLEVPEFAARWHQHDVARKRRGTKAVVHPVEGVLNVSFEVLLLSDFGDQRIVAWLPADEATAAVFERLCAPAEPRSPARLRVVGA